MKFKLKLSKRDVNLILGFLSLIILVSYIFVSYKPKHDIFVEKESAYHFMLEEERKIVNQTPNIKKLEEVRMQYQTKINEKEMQSSNSEAVKENELIVTLEEVAEKTQIDMKVVLPIENLGVQTSITGQESTTTPPVDGSGVDTNNGEPISPNEGLVENANSLSAQTDPNKIPLNANPITQENAVQNTEPVDDGTYTFSIRGEYRSIMVFLFELRNLEYPASVDNFELIYNQGDSKEIGFPLEATFTARFQDKGGVTQ